MSDPAPRYPPGHDPRTVESSADIKFNLGDIDGAKMVYQQALLDWVDEARESASADTEGMKRAVADLWIGFASLSRKANRLKGATEAFEGAVSCEIAGRDGKVWLEYAKYQEGRNRHKTAQKIYLRALVGDDKNGGGGPGAEEASHPMLWEEFLRMVRDLNKTPNLTLQELRSAVETEHVSQMKKDDGDDGDGPPLKRAKMEDDVGGASVMAVAMIMPVPGQGQQAMALDSSVMSAESIEKETAEAVDRMKELSPDISAAWFARDGDSPPSRPEPPLFTPSPPKFSDATGREVLGDELALKLIQMLLKKDESDQSGTILLDVSRACWTMTALKEKEAAKAIETLDNKMSRDLEALEATLESRASVAGEAALAAVQMINEAEKNNFLAGCNQIRQQLIDGHAWQFRELLAVQQQILTKAGVPYFDGSTVDASMIHIQANICAFMHSAFFLRARIGEKQHLAMLATQEKRLAEAVKSAPPSFPPGGGYGVGMAGQYGGYQQMQPPQQNQQQMYQMAPPQGMLMPPPGPNPYA